jgi:arabinogalactan endo-1,4-beta-galactosidase
LRNYVATTLKTSHAAGIPLGLVSLGNEIRNGMLWPTGRVNPSNSKEFTNLATLIKAAREGVSDAVHAGLTMPAVMIHIDNGWNTDLQTKWFSALTGTGIVSVRDWDVIGLSFYPFYGKKATFANLARSMTTLATMYSKPIMVVETDYPARCDGNTKPRPEFSEPKIPISVDGQIEWNRRLIQTVKSVPSGLGQGVFYWEPGWTNNTGLGSSCEDALLFQADWSKWPKTTAYSRKSVHMFK